MDTDPPVDQDRPPDQHNTTTKYHKQLSSVQFSPQSVQKPTTLGTQNCTSTSPPPQNCTTESNRQILRGTNSSGTQNTSTQQIELTSTVPITGNEGLQCKNIKNSNSGEATGKNGGPQSTPLPPKISSNYDRLSNTQKPATKEQALSSLPPIRQNVEQNINSESHTVNTTEPTQTNGIPTIQQLNAKFNHYPPLLSAVVEHNKVNPPLPHAVKPTFANTLRSVHEQSMARIEITPAKQTTKQGYPAIIFKRDDYLVKLAARCRFTLIGKFDSTMPKMETIRRSFELQVQLKGPVKITHFNSTHVYIDLSNQLDHDTVWFKEKIWIQGRPMKLFAWTPTFKPNQETPIAPIWVVLPELPWHMYYMEAVSELLMSVGRAICLDTATFQKSRGSVAKVKLEIGITKPRPRYLWVGYDEDENGEGYWQEVDYENVPEYCIHCKHQGHSISVCSIKRREDHMNNKVTQEEQPVQQTQKVQGQQSVPEKQSNRGRPTPPKLQYVPVKRPTNNAQVAGTEQAGRKDFSGLQKNHEATKGQKLVPVDQANKFGALVEVESQCTNAFKVLPEEDNVHQVATPTDTQKTQKQLMVCGSTAITSHNHDVVPKKPHASTVTITGNVPVVNTEMDDTEINKSADDSVSKNLSVNGKLVSSAGNQKFEFMTLQSGTFLESIVFENEKKSVDLFCTNGFDVVAEWNQRVPAATADSSDRSLHGHLGSTSIFASVKTDQQDDSAQIVSATADGFTENLHTLTSVVNLQNQEKIENTRVTAGNIMAVETAVEVKDTDSVQKDDIVEEMENAVTVTSTKDWVLKTFPSVKDSTPQPLDITDHEQHRFIAENPSATTTVVAHNNVSPAQSGSTLTPTSKLEVICKRASKLMRETGRGFFPVTPREQSVNEGFEPEIIFLGDLFDDSGKDQSIPSKIGKSKWNLNAPLFIPNALRQQESQVATDNVDSQKVPTLEFPNAPSDEVLLKNLDLHDIRGLLLRQNSPPQELPQKFSSAHPGIIEDGSEYEDEDEELTAYNYMEESRHAGLSPRLDQVRKPKLIKKKRRPLELKKKEEAPKEPKRWQPTRSSKSKSTRENYAAKRL